ncbi:protein YAE1 homolog [Apodemus sylvaticus]|uniref:protein YAE1 homolog n=1 Tax=Apodemus sylvaticus TaxID=10129 RepID=UPI002244776E|nr:protein YAE1 homolog [Apodemus sylvaticus]
MSWFRAAAVIPSPEDQDVFDEEADETLLVQREWQGHMRKRVQEGYRDGIDAGKAVTLQQGFNQGYKEGADAIVSYGLLRGTLSALLSWCHLHGNSSTLISKINNLLDAVGQCEECVLKRLKSVTSQPRVTDLLNSIEDMDLCHVVPADEARGDSNAQINTDSDRSPNRIDCSHPECCRTQEHAHLEKPNLTWILEQTSNLVKQLGVSVDILQHLRQL